MVNDPLCSIESSADAELCLRYWARNADGGWNESLESISQDFELPASALQKRVSMSSIAYVCNIRCRSCGTPHSATTRAQYEKLKSSKDHTLLKCGRFECELNRRPINVAATAALLDKRIEFIADELQKFQSDQRPVDYAHVDVVSSFYLYCILIASGQDWYDRELPAMTSHEFKLAPSGLLAQQAYLRLHTQKILTPSIHSPITAFNITNTEDTPITFDIRRACWTMAASESTMTNLQTLAVLRSVFELNYLNEIRVLQERLVEHECLRMLLDGLRSLKIERHHELELQMLFVIQCQLREFSAQAIANALKVISRDTEFKKKIRVITLDELCPAVTETLRQKMELMPISRVATKTENSWENTILKESKYLMSQQFYEIFVKTKQLSTSTQLAKHNS